MTILPAAKVTNLVGIVLVTCLASLSVHINAFPADTENELSPYMSGESANELGDSLLHQLDDYLPHQVRCTQSPSELECQTYWILLF